MKQLIESLLQAIPRCFAARSDHDSHLEQIYGLFSEISRSIEKLRDAGVSGSEISRANGYLRFMIMANT